MNYLNNPHYDVDEAQLDHFDQSAAKRQRYQLWKERLNQVELQIEKDEAAPDPDADLSPKKKRLKRQIKEEALLRLEEAARTEDDFAAVQYHWDRRDSNRERKERYYEVLRGDVPLDIGIAKDPHVFPLKSALLFSWFLGLRAGTLCHRSHAAGCLGHSF